jgi:Trehalose synthase, N-terminal domain
MPGVSSRVLSSVRYAALLDLIDRASSELQGRVIWNVNSTASGGGVVEPLRPLLGYSRGSGVDARWVVITGEPEFFAVTKRLHNRLHGFKGDGGPLGRAEHDVYEHTLAGRAVEPVPLLRPSDVVILHDPQTAGLVDAVRAAGATGGSGAATLGAITSIITPARHGASCAATSSRRTHLSSLAVSSSGRVCRRSGSRSSSRRSMRSRPRTRICGRSNRWPSCRAQGSLRAMPPAPRLTAQTLRRGASTGGRRWSRRLRSGHTRPW